MKGVIRQVARPGISGSAHIGKGVMLWGQAGVAGHLTIGDGAQILAQSGVSKDIPAGTKAMGTPALERREFAKTLALVRSVDKLKERLAALEATRA